MTKTAAEKAAEKKRKEEKNKNKNPDGDKPPAEESSRTKRRKTIQSENGNTIVVSRAESGKVELAKLAKETDWTHFMKVFIK